MKPDKPGDSWDGTAITAVQEDDFGLTDPCNAEFIAAARTAVPALLADVERLEREFREAANASCLEIRMLKAENRRLREADL